MTEIEKLEQGLPYCYDDPGVNIGNNVVIAAGECVIIVTRRNRPDEMGLRAA